MQVTAEKIEKILVEVSVNEMLNGIAEEIRKEWKIDVINWWLDDREENWLMDDPYWRHRSVDTVVVRKAISAEIEIYNAYKTLMLRLNA